MLDRNSLVSAIVTLARMLTTAGRAATRLFRPGGPTASRPPARPAQRPHQGSTRGLQPTIPAQTAGDADHALRGEYRVIRDSEIVPAATPPRLVYDGIDRLAASIAGGSDNEGLGLLNPVVVRVLDDGRYEMVDGDRRLLACRLVAARAGVTDCRIPAIVVSVNDRVALLMRLATLDSAEPRAIELARTYQALCRAMAEEGRRTLSARDLANVGPHGKSQVADYVRIGESISDAVLVEAKLATADGHPSPEALVDLTKAHLLDAAKRDTIESRAVALKGHLARVSGGGRESRGSSAETGTQAEPRNGAARTKGRTLALVARSRTMSPADARTLIEREMAPAMLALVEQAHGGRDAEGYYAALATGHACLVLPREVEGLTLEQLDRLDQALAMLAARTRRAREERKQVDALFASIAERKTS